MKQLHQVVSLKQMKDITPLTKGDRKMPLLPIIIIAVAAGSATALLTED